MLTPSSLKVVPSVTAVIAQHQANRDSLESAVEAVLSQTAGVPLKLVIVVNGERAPSPDWMTWRPEVTLLFPGVNLGYAGALEYARRAFPADYLWVLQEDLVPGHNCLEELLREFDQSDNLSPLAVASPVERPLDDGRKPRERVGIFDQTTGKGIPLETIDLRDWLPRFRGTKGNLRGFVYLSGALISLEALEVSGGFDCRFWPLMLVDADTCLTVQQHGYDVARVSTAFITHPRGKRSSQALPGWKELAHEINLKRLREKHFSGKGKQASVPLDSVPADIIFATAQSMGEFIRSYTLWSSARLALAKRPRPRFVRLFRSLVRTSRKLFTSKTELGWP